VLSVRELLGDLDDAAVLAGHDALDAPVRWVHISELPDPTPWLSGGELLLTTGYQLTDAATQRQYIARLAGHGLAGLGVGVGFAHEKVPEPLIAAARERDFPVLEIPYELPFIAITEQAFTRLVNEEYALLRRSIAAQERLQRVVLAERGLDGIVGALAGLVGGSALVLDSRGTPLASRSFRRPLDDDTIAAIGAEARRRARAGDAQAFAPDHADLHGRALVLPVSGEHGRTPQAWVAGVKDSGGLAEVDRLALHQGATVVALELLRRRVADTTERRLAGDVLAGLASGELCGAELARRLEPFRLGAEVSVVVVEPPLDDALSEALEAEAIPALVAAEDARAVALLPGLPDDELVEVAERVRARIAAEAGKRVAAGAGRAVPAGEARRALHEARCALEARELSASNGSGSAGGAGGAVGTWRDLGSFQLLLALQDHEALGLYCDALLGPIESGEGQYGGELMRSLEAFIECNGQWERAAQQLFCHRHTLRYRIRRIEELTGRDLGSARDRIEFWLALRGKEIASR
jgi:purine catabolism regulator